MNWLYMKVSNMSDAIKIACDYVSIENVSQTARLVDQFREQRLAIEGDDVLQFYVMLWYAWVSVSRSTSNLATLRLHTPTSPESDIAIAEDKNVMTDASAHQELTSSYSPSRCTPTSSESDIVMADASPNQELSSFSLSCGAPRPEDRDVIVDAFSSASPHTPTTPRLDSELEGGGIREQTTILNQEPPVQSPNQELSSFSLSRGAPRPEDRDVIVDAFSSASPHTPTTPRLDSELEGGEIQEQTMTLNQEPPVQSHFHEHNSRPQLYHPPARYYHPYPRPPLQETRGMQSASQWPPYHQDQSHASWRTSATATHVSDSRRRQHNMDAAALRIARRQHRALSTRRDTPDNELPMLMSNLNVAITNMNMFFHSQFSQGPSSYSEFPNY
jgi:hypothetical protein